MGIRGVSFWLPKPGAMPDASRNSRKRRHHDDDSTGIFSRSFNPKGLRTPPGDSRTPQCRPPPPLGRHLPEHASPEWRRDSISSHGFNSSRANPRALADRKRNHMKSPGSVTAPPYRPVDGARAPASVPPLRVPATHHGVTIGCLGRRRPNSLGAPVAA